MKQSYNHITRICKLMDSCPLCDTQECPDILYGCLRGEVYHKEKTDSLDGIYAEKSE